MARKNQTAISDEQIIAALFSNGTIREAAQAVGLSERAIYDRMKDGNFQALYKEARAETLRTAATDLNKQIRAAVETIAQIMTDPANNPAIRLQAAQTILNNAGKYSKHLQEAEDAAERQNNDNVFFGS